MKTLTQKAYWEGLGIKPQTQFVHIEFSDLFFKYLTPYKTGARKTMLDIGCAPGRFLSYLAKYYNYVPEGIDYIHGTRRICEETLKNMGIREYRIYEEDFLTWKADKKYDLVCSFGFIEHFADPDPVIDKQIALMKNNGIVIIEMPNFGGWQKYLRSVLDKNDLSLHNTSIMNMAYFKHIMRRHNLGKIFAGYYGGLFGFWWNNNNPSSFQRIVYSLLIAISKVTRRINVNNRFLSPYLIFIGKA